MRSDADRGDRGPEVVRLRSAGGVVLRGEGEELRVALIRSLLGEWVFPKGLIEAGEEPEAAARREVQEEVGLSRLALRAGLGWTEHRFGRNGKRFRNRVYWFLYQAGPRAVMRLNPAEEVLECGWFAPGQALALLTHANQRRLLRRALAGLAAVAPN